MKNMMRGIMAGMLVVASIGGLIWLINQFHLLLAYAGMAVIVGLLSAAVVLVLDSAYKFRSLSGQIGFYLALTSGIFAILMVRAPKDFPDLLLVLFLLASWIGAFLASRWTHRPTANRQCQYCTEPGFSPNH